MGVIKVLYRAVSSMKAGLILLGAIGLMSAIGSVFFPKSFYQATYFKLLLILLLLNMTLCTINQLSKYFRNGSKNHHLTLRTITLLILHIGVVLILVGGVIQSAYGNGAKVGIVQGESVEIPYFVGSKTPLTLQLDEFYIEYYPDGSASQYYSALTLYKGQEKVAEQTISVNYPLKYEGTKVYQADYGYLIGIRGESISGWLNKMILSEGETFYFPDSKKSLEIRKYVPDYDPNYGINSKSLRPDNPRIFYYVHEQGKDSRLMFAPLGYRVEIDPGVYFEFNDLQPYSIFIVKTDPGLPFAASGGLMLMIGTCFVLFFAPSKRKTQLLRENQ